MIQESEIAQKGAAAQQPPKQENMGLLMVKMLLKKPSMLIKLRRMGPMRSGTSLPSARTTFSSTAKA